MSLLDTGRLAVARTLFKKNQIYAIDPPIKGKDGNMYSQAKYFDTYGFDDGAILHVFGKADGPDETTRRTPKTIISLDDMHLKRNDDDTKLKEGEYRVRPFYATRIAEIATRENLPPGIAREIQKNITGKSERERARARGGKKRTRKTKRASRRH